MTTTYTPGLELTEHADGALQAHVTANENNRVLEMFNSVPILEIGDTSPPTGVAPEGALHIVGAGATGDWSAQDGKLALGVNGAWRYIPPKSGMQLFVSRSATHHFKGCVICYSEDESLWFPVHKLLSTTEHWTGQYFLGSSEKMYAKTYTGNINSGTSVQNIAHGLTIDFSVGAWVEGYIFDNVVSGKRGAHMPGRKDSAQIALTVDNTNIIFLTTATLGSDYDYVFTVYYAK